MIKLFLDILTGEVFSFGDKPERQLIKSDRSHYIAPEGRRPIHPHVAVIPKRYRPVMHSAVDINSEKGLNHERQPNDR